MVSAPFISAAMITPSRAVLIVTTVMACGGATAAEMTANAVFLVAKPEMTDPRFQQTVVLVTHPERGAPWGVIVNRPLDHPLSEVFPDHPSLKGGKDVLYFGGPVARDGLMFLVRAPRPPPRSVPVLKNVYFTGDADWIDGFLKRANPTEGLRVYAGYSGWAPGQLDSEIARGGWHVLPADAATVFDKESSRIWPELIERANTHRTRSLIRD